MRNPIFILMFLLLFSGNGCAAPFPPRSLVVVETPVVVPASVFDAKMKFHQTNGVPEIIYLTNAIYFTRKNLA